METVLVAFIDDLQRYLDWGRFALLLLLNITAEFDMVDHNLLTHCLIPFGAGWAIHLKK